MRDWLFIHIANNGGTADVAAFSRSMKGIAGLAALNLKNRKMEWIDFKKRLPKEGQIIIIAEPNYGAYKTAFEFDKKANYDNCKWCIWPF